MRDAAESHAAGRDYSSISPSALSLLLMKSRTSIPYAKQAAALLWGDTVPGDLAHAMTAENARRRARHFENRYRSLDQLLREAACPNVLELGAGLSFRGLELTRTTRTSYIDSDLPEITWLKSELLGKLAVPPALGDLRVRALDALNARAFEERVSELPDGPLAIANEGLLVYLNPQEKARLAANVYAALGRRGGEWLTADVYVKNPGGSAPTVGYGRSRQFIDQHRIEQNKFDSFAAAQLFFERNGFRIARKLAHEHPRHVRESWALLRSR